MGKDARMFKAPKTDDAHMTELEQCKVDAYDLNMLSAHIQQQLALKNRRIAELMQEAAQDGQQPLQDIQRKFAPTP